MLVLSSSTLPHLLCASFPVEEGGGGPCFFTLSVLSVFCSFYLRCPLYLCSSTSAISDLCSLFALSSHVCTLALRKPLRTFCSIPALSCTVCACSALVFLALHVRSFRSHLCAFSTFSVRFHLCAFSHTLDFFVSSADSSTLSFWTISVLATLVVLAPCAALRYP